MNIGRHFAEYSLDPPPFIGTFQGKENSGRLTQRKNTSPVFIAGGVSCLRPAVQFLPEQDKSFCLFALVLRYNADHFLWCNLPLVHPIASS
jgi:hypothetical protein